MLVLGKLFETLRFVIRLGVTLQYGAHRSEEQTVN